MLKKLGVLLLTGIMVAGLSACSTSTTTPDTSADTSTNSEATSTYTYDKEYQFAAPVSGDQVAIFKTTMGDITVKLFPNDAPKAVENFVTHAQNGYYDGLSFHRVINDFMIQGGDPAGDGTGGESIWGTAFEDELTPNLHNFRGALSMANSGANTNGSQFFIVQTNSISESYIDSILEYRAENETAPVNQLADGTIVNFGDIFNDDVLARFKEVGGTPHLDYAHTVFGQVVEGMDIVDAIAATETDANDKPVTPIMVNTIEIKTID